MKEVERETTTTPKSTKRQTSSSSSTCPSSSGAESVANSPVDLTKEQMFPKHKSGLFDILRRDANGNLRLRCLVCSHELWHPSAKTHVRIHHPARLAEYEQGKSRTIAEHFKPRLRDQKEDPCVGTVDNVNKMIAQYLVSNRLALSQADDADFRNLLTTVKNFGAAASNEELRKYTVPSRRLLVEEYIEGEDGILQEHITNAIRRLEPSCREYGATLLFDGAKDANGKGLEVFMLQSGPHQTLVWNGIPQGESENTDWMATTIKSLIHGHMNFQTMSILDPDEVPEELPPSSSSSTSAARVKRQKTVAVSHLGKLFSLMPHVFAMGGDNAKVPVNAALRLEKEIATIPFGCAGHSYSRSFQHICEISEISENVIEKANEIVDLFLSRSQVREFLRMECAKSLYRLIPTRFVSAAGVCERLLDLQSDLICVVDSKKFGDYRNNATAEIRRQCDKVKSILRDDHFWVWLGFFSKLSTGYVAAVRCMDGAKAGSACLVYKLWSMLSGTIEAAFLEEKDRTIASKELFEKVIAVICKDWKKFHFPVYSAAYVLTPQFRQDILNVRDSDPLVAMELIKDTAHCCATFFRRFDKNGKPRPEVLDPDDPDIEAIRQVLIMDIQSFVKGEGKFTRDMFEAHLMDRSPSDWWAWVGSQTESLLRWPAMRITALSPSTTPVERLHKVHKANRTKARNLIGYARALGLNFICCERLMARLPNDIQLDWQHLKHYNDRFTRLSDLDTKFLQAIEEEAVAMSNALAEVLEEEVITPDTIAQDAIDGMPLEEADESSSESDVDEEPGSLASETPLSQEAENESELPRSMRGRIIKRKLFRGYYML